jgi:sec-independent protein translocase protein TatA
MFGFGLPEMAIVAVVILLLFGNRLPGAMRSLGRSVVEFKKGVRDDAPNGDGQDNEKVADKSKSEEKAAK